MRSRGLSFFSVIPDEVTDAANKEELSLVLRYVLNNEIKEVFVDFVEVERITGEVLAQSILGWLRIHGLSPSDIRGQCYDGASNMSGARSGCISIIQQVAPLAMYYHCAAHRLNLAIVSACSIQAFKNAESEKLPGSSISHLKGNVCWIELLIHMIRHQRPRG